MDKDTKIFGIFEDDITEEEAADMCASRDACKTCDEEYDADTLEGQGWEKVESKYVTDESGFQDVYYWYKNPESGLHRFYFASDVDYGDPEYFDWETENEQEAKDWFDSYGEEEESEYLDFQGHDTRTGDDYDANERAWGKDTDLDESASSDEGEPVETESDELDYLADLFNVKRLPKDNSVPAFKESAVNEFQFPKGMRAKYYDARNDGDNLFVEWITQEPFTAEDADAFKKELNRFFQYTIDHAHFEYPKTVKVKVTCRDGKEDGFATFELRFGDKAKAECVSLNEASSELEDLTAIRLNKFYDILSRNATVTLTDRHLDKVYYEGSVRDIPAKYDDCVVEDFAFDGGNALLFKIKVEDAVESLTEDTVKLKDGKWANKGKEGMHGTFRTKKAADAQRRAIWVNWDK